MRTSIRAATAAAAIAGAGLAGFGLTTAFAQTDEEAPTTTEAPAPAEDGARPDGPGCHGRGPGLEAMAEAIGIEVEDLRAALQDGQTPAEVAEENGVSREDLVAAIVDDINAHLDEAVEEGRLTEEEADERRADAEDHANDIVDGVRPEGMRPGPGGPPPGEEDTEADA